MSESEPKWTPPKDLPVDKSAFEASQASIKAMGIEPGEVYYPEDGVIKGDPIAMPEIILPGVCGMDGVTPPVTPPLNCYVPIQGETLRISAQSYEVIESKLADIPVALADLREQLKATIREVSIPLRDVFAAHIIEGMMENPAQGRAMSDMDLMLLARQVYKLADFIMQVRETP